MKTTHQRDSNSIVHMWEGVNSLRFFFLEEYGGIPVEILADF